MFLRLPWSSRYSKPFLPPFSSPIINNAFPLTQAYVPGSISVDKKRFTLGDISSGLGSLAKKATNLSKDAISSAANLASGNKEGNFNFVTKEERKEGVFEVPLEDVMALQKDQPELEVPRVVVHLIDAVVNMGGCKTEGIFRVPANAVEVQFLKKQINSGNYEIQAHSKDVNVPAALLKLWLRSLPDALVPTPLYDAALASPGPEGALAVFAKLPPLNSKVISHLIKFLALMAEPDHVKATLMTLENLAMVFAPSLLRCPSDDPLTILASAKRECSFMKNLIIGLQPSVLAGQPPMSPIATTPRPMSYGERSDSPAPARSSQYQEDPAGEQSSQQQPQDPIEKEFDELAGALGSSDS